MSKCLTKSLRFQGLLTKYHGYFPAGSGGGLPGY